MHTSMDGGTYYYSASRNESVWSRPEEYVENPVVNDASVYAQVDHSAFSLMHNPMMLMGGSGAGLNDWVMAHDDDGVPYFHSASRGESRWEMPAEVQQSLTLAQMHPPLQSLD